MKRKVDATQGSLIPLIFSYTIPLILTTIAQDLFVIADKAVLGNMADTAAVAAIGATSTISSLSLNGFVGLASGTAIVLGRYVGQKDYVKSRTVIDTSLIAGVAFGVLVALVGVMAAPLFLTLTNCPEECYDGALLYIRIYISAAPATLLYNYGATILRTLGDSRRPFKYIMIAGVANVVLNVILCIILPEKVAAVAIATITSKIISAVLVVNRLCHFEDDSRVDIKNLKFSFETFRNLMRFGVPTALHKLIFPLANLQIVSAINSFGVDAIAGTSAMVSVNSITNAVTGSFGITTITFMGQNIGAKQTDRVRKSLLYCLLFSVGLGGAIGLFLHITGEFWLGLILGRSAVEAIGFGMIRSAWVTRFMFLSGANAVLSHALQAYGYPVFSSINSIVFTLGFRIVWMQLIYPGNPTFAMVMMCFTVSWGLIMLFNSVATLILTRRYNKGAYRKI